MHTIALHCVGVSSPFVRSLTSALSQLDIITADLADAHPPGPGIVIFEALTDEVRGAVRQLSRTGYDRVLALAAKGCALSSEAAWELIEVGAADVLVWDDCSDPITTIVARIERWVQVEQLLRSASAQNKLASESCVWYSVLRQIVEIARFAAPSTAGLRLGCNPTANCSTAAAG